jgi:peptidoglycan/xylan/chitin deacetylase (PgdA/CDA1 family)
MSDVTVVMYHYVRPLEQTRFPDIKGRRLAEFRRQVEHLRATYRMVGADEVVAALRGEDPLPERAAWLTFDDGFADHYDYVFPVLDDVKVPGSFFPPARPVLEREILDVHRIQFILAACQDPIGLRAELDAQIRARSSVEGVRSPDEYWAEYGQANRFDSAEVIYVKRVLQVGLPAAERSSIASALFARYVTADEAAFAEELYVSADQLRVMQRAGMHVGSHGRSHRWLSSLSDAEQAEEIDGSLAFLREIGSPVDDYWVMCYPYGDYDQRTLDLLRSRSCAVGLTTHVGVWNPRETDSLVVPRLDTNDLPH